MAVGSIPLVGDAFDAFFKANTRNIQLLTQVAEQRVRNKQIAVAPSVLYIVGIVAAIFGMLALVLIGFVTVIAWLLKRPLF